MRSLGQGSCRSSRRREHAGAFTIIELLVVIGIIGVLIGITFAVGRSVVNTSKRQATEDTLRILDTALQAYIDKTDALPPAFMWQMQAVKDPAAAPPPDFDNYLICIDGVAGPAGNRRAVNSVGMFMVMAGEVPEVKAILDKIPSRFVRTLDIDGAGAANPQPPMPTVFDAWGNPIRFVLPSLDGRVVGSRGDAAATNDASRPAAQAVPMPSTTRNQFSPPGVSFAPTSMFTEVRRNGFTDLNLANAELPDSDGSRSTNNRPYFYSAGDDGRVGMVVPVGGDPATDRLDYNADNVYTTKPTLPRKQG